MLHNLPHFTHILCSFLPNPITNHCFFPGIKGLNCKMVFMNRKYVSIQFEISLIAMKMNSVSTSINTKHKFKII